MVIGREFHLAGGSDPYGSIPSQDRKIAQLRGCPGIHVPRNARVGNSILNSSVRSGKTNGSVLYEAIVELKRI